MTPRTAITQIAKMIGQELEAGAGPSEGALAAGPMLAEAGATTELVDRLADQGSDRDSTGVAPKSTFANRDLIAWVGLEVKPRIGRRYGAALVKSRRACVGYPNGSSTPRRLGWSARAAGGGGAVGTAARPGINHAALAATRIGIAAGPGRRKLRRRRPATVDPQSCSRTRHRTQHGGGRFRAARG